jgi:hypothetical protein
MIRCPERQNKSGNAGIATTVVDKIHGITFQSKRKMFEQNGRHALGCLILLQKNEEPLLRIENARGS